MRFTMIVKNEGADDSTAWEEHEDRAALLTREQCEQWSRDTLARFNATLRSHERPRALVRVDFEDDSKSSAHDFIKQNGATIMRGNRSYDFYKCSRCGVTGKRFGLSEVVVLDKQYSANVYQDCQAARAHIVAQRERKQAKQ